MKKISEFSIFACFLILFLLRDSIDHFLISYLKEPNLDANIQIKNQNLENQLRELEETLKINTLNEKSLVSKILYRDIFSLKEEITILKGTEDGLKENMAVLQDDKLIGTITQLEKHQSKVKLLTSQKNTLSIKLNDHYGILSKIENDYWIDDFDKHVKVKEGDLIYTSGLTEIPANILVGEVITLEKDELGLIQKIKIKLLADFENISYVTLLGKDNHS